MVGRERNEKPEIEIERLDTEEKKGTTPFGSVGNTRTGKYNKEKYESRIFMWF